MNLWEKRDAPRPPEYTIEYSPQERDKNNLRTGASSLLESLQRGYVALTNKEVLICLRREIGILTATLYCNGRHRTEKFYRVLRKVEKSCARWQQLGVAEELERLCPLIPRIIFNRRIMRLPSKQMFEYLLARLLGSYHLMLHLDGICREAASLLLLKISTGHFFSTAVAFLSNVARIRVFAVDFAGQVAKIYDDILPWVNCLKGSEASPLLDTTSLPSSLSVLLQQYCSSRDVNKNSLSGNKLSGNTHFLNSLDVSMEEGSTNTLKVDQFIDSSVGKNLVNEESVNSKAKASSERVDISVSSSFMEDIGECVQMTKPHKKNKVTKKRKLSQKISSDCGPSDESASKGVKTRSMAAMNPSLNLKKKKAKKNLVNTDLGKTKLNKKKKFPSKPNEEHCSPAFIKHFKAVKKQTKCINSIVNLREFLQREKKNRHEKVNGRVSVLLKKEDWREFAKFVRTRLKNIKGLNKMDSSDCEVPQQLLGKTRVRVKFWLLFPHLKGKKPGNWKTILENIAK